MVKTIDNSILLLRILEDVREEDFDGFSIEQLMEISDLDKKQIDSAINFLYERDYVKANIADKYSISAQGLSFLNAELSSRYPLSLSAERILRLLEKLPRQKYDFGVINKDEVMQKLDISSEDFERACTDLSCLDFIETYSGETDETGFPDICIKNKGRLALLNNLKNEKVPSYLNTGAIFSGNITAENFSAISNSTNSQVNQTNSSNDLTQISNILENLIEKISPDLGLDEKNKYSQTAILLDKEVKKANPDTKKIQKFLSSLAFLDKTFLTTKNGIELAEKAIPFISSIIRTIVASGIIH